MNLFRTAGRTAITMGVAACLLMLASAGALRAAEPLRLNAGPHLLVDDTLVARRQGIAVRVQPCRKLDRPVLEPEKPWEGQRVYVYGSVIEDPALPGRSPAPPGRSPATGELRMWYMSRVEGGPKRDPELTHSRGARDLVLYATSRDGIRWTRPNLGLYEFDGSRDNNIVFDLHSPSVISDPADPDPRRRYKMLGYGQGAKDDGYCAAWSPDGLHWQAAPDNPILPRADTITLVHDAVRGEYLALHKRHVTHGAYSRRLVYVSSSKDFRTWSQPQLALAPDAEDDAWAKSPGQRTEFYNLSAFLRGDLFVGLVTVFRLRQRLEKAAVGQSRDDGPIDVQLVFSRDGRRWQRCPDRSPVIPNGPQPYDAGCILGVSNTPVIRDGQMWLYYTGINTTHGGALPEKRLVIGRAAWRLDGLVAMEAGLAEGQIETVPLEVEGQRLLVNAAVSDGSLRVEVLDAAGRTLPGYAAADCRPVKSDGLALAVGWAAGDRLPTGQAVRLRFLLCGGRCFSFTLAK